MRDRAREKEIIAKATRGTWEYGESQRPKCFYIRRVEGTGVVVVHADSGVNNKRDAAFIAAARTGWPDDLEWRERAEELLKSIEWVERKDDFGSYIDTCCPYCGNSQSDGHKLDCELTALLPKDERQP